MNAILLDTHVWIWYANGSEDLSKPARKAITEALHQHKAFIAAISLWEIGMLNKKQRIILGMPYLEWINQSLELTHLQIAPLTTSIAAESCQLPGEFHGDPADQLIVSTARVEGLTLVTRDKLILAYSQQQYLTTLKA
jgi:PIN domain nuclease of toxin-antitoxin system